MEDIKTFLGFIVVAYAVMIIPTSVVLLLCGVEVGVKDIEFLNIIPAIVVGIILNKTIK